MKFTHSNYTQRGRWFGSTSVIKTKNFQPYLLEYRWNKYDLDRIQKLIKVMPNIIQNGANKGAVNWANRIKAIVVRALTTGEPPAGVHWPPHAASTIRKYENGRGYPYNRYHGTLLNLTGEYAKSVGVFKLFGKQIAVGVPPHLRHRGIRTTDLAKIHEFGTNRIPARPVWAPAYNQVEQYGRAGHGYDSKTGDEHGSLRQTIKFYIIEELDKHEHLINSKSKT